ncbi:hypothetical protein NJT12_11620 [Flavobacterium sp. AC]|uniref:Uncharacterized protein n=1 Tax=Flavobacterium azizsancarii TaxID=2961580 RepID=A0ABT4WCL7_9FLAO|nr:hypothetical protein [Flavobacterium azizsancarii]MDA6070267.1 hypothetical protein [Flavobacterium azizsancarii]
MKYKILFLLIVLLSFNITKAQKPNNKTHYQSKDKASNKIATDTLFADQYTQVNGIKLHYVTCGSGPAADKVQ